MFSALSGSAIVKSHRHGDGQVQDAYSLRCAPQVAGAVRDTIDHARVVATRELQATIDNPVVLDSGEISSNGNFHGAPVGYVLDFLAIAATDLASISERRIDRMMDKNRNNGLNAFLAGDAGVDSGLMIAQYTAAGLVSESKRLANPASVDSIPTSAMQEDHVSMGWHAGRKLRKIVENLRSVLAIELIAAGRCLDLRAPLKPAETTAQMLNKLRKVVPGVGPDRFLAPEIAAATELLR
jgi:histidine ammonia-lyase